MAAADDAEVDREIGGLISGKPEQSHERQSIFSLYQNFRNGRLKLAALNRDPVWRPNKQASYILSLLRGEVTPPLYVNRTYAAGGPKEYIYDGGNRFQAICDFLSGALDVKLDSGHRFQYREGKDGLPPGVQLMRPERRGHFDGLQIDIFVWHDLSEERACGLARLLNQGTQMSVAERLKLELAQETPRARLVRRVYDSVPMTALRKKDPRESLLRSVIVAVRALLDEDRILSVDLEQRVHTETLRNFLTAPDEVPDQDAHCERIVAAAWRAVEQGTQHFHISAFHAALVAGGAAAGDGSKRQRT